MVFPLVEAAVVVLDLVEIALAIEKRGRILPIPRCNANYKLRSTSIIECMSPKQTGKGIRSEDGDGIYLTIR